MKLSKPQQGAFWLAMSTACAAQLLQGAEREAYRHRVLQEEVGCEHLADVNRTNEYDAVMARLWMDADRPDLAFHYLNSADERPLKVARDMVSQILSLRGRDPSEGALYLKSILRQAGLDRFVTSSAGTADILLDVPPELTLWLIRVLDTHRRRLLRSRGLPTRYIYGATHAPSNSPS